MTHHTAIVPLPPAELDAMIAAFDEKWKMGGIHAYRALEQRHAAGILLQDIKKRLGHGRWLPFLEERGIPERTARTTMALAEWGWHRIEALKSAPGADLNSANAVLQQLKDQDDPRRVEKRRKKEAAAEDARRDAQLSAGNEAFRSDPSVFDKMRNLNGGPMSAKPPGPEPLWRPSEQPAAPKPAAETWDLAGGVDEAVMVRINMDVHRRATRKAKNAGRELEDVIRDVCRDAVNTALNEWTRGGVSPEDALAGQRADLLVAAGMSRNGV